MNAVETFGWQVLGMLRAWYADHAPADPLLVIEDLARSTGALAESDRLSEISGSPRGFPGGEREESADGVEIIPPSPGCSGYAVRSRATHNALCAGNTLREAITLAQASFPGRRIFFAGAGAPLKVCPSCGESWSVGDPGYEDCLRGDRCIACHYPCRCTDPTCPECGGVCDNPETWTYFSTRYPDDVGARYCAPCAEDALAEGALTLASPTDNLDCESV